MTEERLTLEERHRIERSWWEEGPAAIAEEDLLAYLRDRYRPEPPPGPCPVCGDKRTVAATGPGPTTYACAPLEDDPDNPGVLRDKPGRGRNAASRKEDDEHYRRSQTYQHRHGDPLVMELLGRVGARGEASTGEAGRPGKGPRG